MVTNLQEEKIMKINDVFPGAVLLITEGQHNGCIGVVENINKTSNTVSGPVIYRPGIDNDFLTKSSIRTRPLFECKVINMSTDGLYKVLGPTKYTRLSLILKNLL